MWKCPENNSSCRRKGRSSIPARLEYIKIRDINLPRYDSPAWSESVITPPEVWVKNRIFCNNPDYLASIHFFSAKR